MSEGTPGPIDGVWELVRAEMDGEQAPELAVTQTELILAAGTYEVRFAGKIVDRGSFDLGGTSDTGTMVLQGAEGTNAGRAIPCIYQQTGDRLRVCYGLEGITPTEFSTAPGERRYLAKYRRSVSPSRS